MRNENDSWMILYEALNKIYNPNQETIQKEYIFTKALVGGLITYAAYKKIRDHFMADGSWYF